VLGKNGENEYFSETLLFISLQREEEVTDWIKRVLSW
jgi:hypothetical protein